MYKKRCLGGTRFENYTGDVPDVFRTLLLDPGFSIWKISNKPQLQPTKSFNTW
jgi:hypothetical protein